MKSLSHLLLLSFLLFTNLIFAKNSFNGNWDVFTFTSDEKNGFFFYYQSETRFYSKSTAGLELPARDEQLLRVALGYHVNKNISLWSGYDFFQLLQNSNNYLQVGWVQGQYYTALSNYLETTLRARLEERFLHVVPGSALRTREMGVLTFKNIISDKIFPTIYDEVFFNLNHPLWVSRRTMSQNRIFVGTQIRLNKDTNCTIGYLNRVLYLPNIKITDHILHVTLNVVLG